MAVVKECAGSTPDDRLIWSVIEQLNGELAEGDKRFSDAQQYHAAIYNRRTPEFKATMNMKLEAA
ncbi:hypothetical protein ACLB1E_34270 [Escherichia coli]